LYRSADPLRPSDVRGGDWFAMTGSPWLIVDSGDTEGAIALELSIIGDRNGRPYPVLKLDAGTESVLGPDVKNAGVPNSEGELAVVADMGY